MNTYNIVVKHPLTTRKLGEVVDTVNDLKAAMEKVHEWKTFFGNAEWKVEYKIVRQ